MPALYNDMAKKGDGQSVVVATKHDGHKVSQMFCTFSIKYITIRNIAISRINTVQIPTSSAESSILKVRSIAANMTEASFESESTTSCRRLSYMTGSKKAKSCQPILRPRMYLITWRLKCRGHISFCSRHSPMTLQTYDTHIYLFIQMYFYRVKHNISKSLF